MIDLKERLTKLGQRLNIDVEAIEDKAERRSKAIKLEQLKLNGYDTCKLCGAEVPVYKDDEWADIFERLEEHAVARDDHVDDPQDGWVLADGV